MSRHEWKNRVLTLALSGLLGVACLLPACAAEWQHNVLRHGVQFEQLRQAKNGTITGRVEADVVYQGMTCKAGWIRFYASWRLKSCVLEAPLAMKGFRIPKNTWVEFGQNGHLAKAAFPENIRIQHHECIGTIGAPKGVHTAFYPDGRLKYFYTPTNLTIFGIPCRGGRFFSGIGLHKNGHVHTCTLSEESMINGTTCHKGQTIMLTPDGKLAAPSQ